MKNQSELLKTPPVFLHNFDSKFAVMCEFEHVYMTEKDFNSVKSPWNNESYWLEEKKKVERLLPVWKDKNILFASYGIDNYSGDAWVLFEQNGELYEVSASHCSCYGLEGQWEPQSVNLKELENRVVNGTFGKDDYSGNEFANELKEFLGINQIS